MNISAVKRLVQQHDLHTLRQVEAQITEGHTPQIEVDGEDEGEQLTHVLGAIWVLETQAEQQLDVNAALRKFAGRVRDSIN